MRRLDLKVGFSCNSLCRHCVQGEKRYTKGDKPSEQVISEIEEARKRGISEIVFTGGEPTVREELATWISHAKEIGYKYIQLQTNGRRFASKAFTKKMVEAGKIIDIQGFDHLIIAGEGFTSFVERRLI